MLAASTRFTGTRNAARTSTSRAGSRAAGCRTSPWAKMDSTSGRAPPPDAVDIPRAKYTAQAPQKGTSAERTIRAMFWNRSVPVSSLTSRALVDTGEHRSPKNTPDRTAPPTSTGFSPMAPEMLMQITPMVAAVPKAVPVRTDTPQFIKKAKSRKAEGWRNRTQMVMITAMVPQARQRAVSIPMNRNRISTFRTV